MPFRFLLFLSLLASLAAAQDLESGTRAARIDAERKARKAAIKPPAADKAAQVFDEVTDAQLFEKLLGGFPGLRLKIGGLPTGSGFAIGPEYYRPDLAKGDVVVRAYLVGSLRTFYRMGAYLGLPRIKGNRFSTEFFALHDDLPRYRYYGPGRTSRVEDRSYFRREETAFDFRSGWRPTRRNLLVGLTGGYTMLNVGPGTWDPSSHTLFLRAPGMNEQTHYLRGGPFLDFDVRDAKDDPHRGSHLESSLIYYDDRKHGRYSFKRFSAQGEQYIPFLNEKRVVALRARTDFSFRNPGQIVPFYVQPTLGGSDDLRGFERFRFYDNNLVLINAEYRWEVFPALDMALFADGGKVFNRVKEFDLRHIQTSAGIGFRLKNRDAVALRFDIGYSREGLRVWLKFGNAF